MWVTRHHSCWVSPFGHPRIHARLAAPRGITQPPTSFIGSQCQGIHHAPLNTYNTKNQNKEKKKLHITTHNNPHSRNPHRPKRRQKPPHGSLRARCSQPLSTNQTPHPTTKAGQQQEPPTRKQSGTKSRQPPPTWKSRGPVVSKPNSVSDDPPPKRPSLLLHQTPTHYRCEAIQRIAQHQLIPPFVGPARSRGAP